MKNPLPALLSRPPVLPLRVVPPSSLSRGIATRAERPLSRRSSEPARREFHLAYELHPNRDVQLHFGASEQAGFGFPAAIRFQAGSSFIDEDGDAHFHGRFASVEPSAAIRQPVCEIQTAEAAGRVRQAIERAAAHRYDLENTDGLNSVGAASLVIEAALQTQPLAPIGEYVSAHELAQEVRMVLATR